MRVAVVMPAWNEAEGIGEFISELSLCLSSYETSFVVIDDCSTDNTPLVVADLAITGIDVQVHVNEHNSGHGPSTITALGFGLGLKPDVVIAIDGDGQFAGDDVRRVADLMHSSDVDVVEGVRTSREDPVYRRVVTGTTRVLVWSRARKRPSDANTPLRAYRPPVLERLLLEVPSESLTPNLFISAFSRAWNLKIIETAVVSLPRRGSVQQSTTWGKSWRSLPTKRFVRFCAKASADWFRTPIGSQDLR